MTSEQVSKGSLSVRGVSLTYGTGAKAVKALDEISFDAPDKKGETVTITADYVDETVGTLAKNADLSKFIL